MPSRTEPNRPAFLAQGAQASHGLPWQRNQQGTSQPPAQGGEEAAVHLPPETLRLRMMAGIQTEVSLSTSQRLGRVCHHNSSRSTTATETAQDPQASAVRPVHIPPPSSEAVAADHRAATRGRQRSTAVRMSPEPASSRRAESSGPRASLSLPAGPKGRMAQPSDPHDGRAHWVLLTCAVCKERTRTKKEAVRQLLNRLLTSAEWTVRRESVPKIHQPGSSRSEWTPRWKDPRTHCLKRAQRDQSHG